MTYRTIPVQNAGTYFALGATSGQLTLIRALTEDVDRPESYVVGLHFYSFFFSDGILKFAGCLLEKPLRGTFYCFS